MEVWGFPHQVGGHFGLLRCCGHVCKPLNQREYAFYMQMEKRFLPFTPTFCGRIKVNLCSFPDGSLAMCTDRVMKCHNLMPVEESNFDLDAHKFDDLPVVNAENKEITTSNPTNSRMTFRVKKCGKVEAEKVTNLWAGQCQSKVVQKLLRGNDKGFVMLEDVVGQFRYPCVIDLKMGTRQYGDDASAQKRANQTQKCRQSTSEQLGVRMVGMQLYDNENCQYVYVNKYEGRRMDRARFHDNLLRFLEVAGKSKTNRLINQLEKLRTVLRNSEGFRFFSSSLLIAYDAASSSQSSNENDEISVRMIDFAHSTFTGFMDDANYLGCDEGYLLGIESLISALKQIFDGTLKPLSGEATNCRSLVKRKLSVIPNDGDPDELEKSRGQEAGLPDDIHTALNTACRQLIEDEKIAMYIENSSSESSSDDILGHPTDATPPRINPLPRTIPVEVLPSVLF